MRSVITAFLSSLSELGRRSKIDIWPGALFPHCPRLGRQLPGHRTRGGPRLTPRLAPFDRRFGDTVAVFRACCGQSRIQAGVASGIGVWRVSTRVAPPARPAFPGCQRRAVEAICRTFYDRCTARLTAQERGRPRTYSAASAARCQELSSADNRAAALGRARVLHAPLVWLRYKLHLGLAEFRTGAHCGLSSDLQTSAPTGTTHEVTS